MWGGFFGYMLINYCIIAILINKLNLKTFRMKKAITIIAILLFVSLQTFSQAHDWSWGKGIGGPQNDQGASIVSDASGNVYMTGSFYSNTITFGAYTLTNFDSSYNNTADIFLVKYDPNGNVLWAERFGGASGDIPESMTLDANGNIFITGYFYSNVIPFGPDSLKLNDTVDFNCQVFLMKFNSDGAPLWCRNSKSLNFLSESIGYCVKTDNSGNVYITGHTNNIIIFETDTLRPSGMHGCTLFLAKYDASGNYIWGTSPVNGFPEANGDTGYGLATDASGNVYLSGGFCSNDIWFGNNHFINLSQTGGSSPFLAKYSPSGVVLWAKTPVNNSIWASECKMVFGADGFLYVTFCGSWGSSNGSVLNKFNSNGGLIWQRDYSGPDHYGEYNSDIFSDLNGNIYVTGYFNDSLFVLGSDTVRNDTIINSSSSDLFIAKYDGSGNVIWAKSAGGTNNDYAFGGTVDHYGNIYLTGYYNSNSMVFGGDTLLNDTTNHSSDIFFTRITNTNCSANFNLYPDTSQVHHYWAINNATGVQPLHYLWSWGDSTYDTIPYPSHVYADSGIYTICLSITDSSGCTSTYCDSSYHIMRTSNYMVYVNVISNILTAIKTPNSKNEISVYPNPSSSTITIQQSTPSPNQQLLITNILGEEIYHQAMNNSTQTTIDVSQWSNGVYFYQIRGDKETLQGKFVKQ